MRTLLFALIPLAVVTSDAFAQKVVARVVDERSRQPVEDARITITDAAQNTRASATTNRTGFFEVQLQAGLYMLTIAHAAYHGVQHELEVSDDARVDLPAILLRPSAIELDPLDVRSRSRERTQTDDEKKPSAQAVLAGAKMAELERVNASVATVYREIAPGVRVRNVGNSVCVETARGPQSMSVPRGRAASGQDSCDALAVVLDGMLVQNGGQILRNLQIRHYESIEYLNPIETGFRFGLDAGPGGAIVLWTRGFGPHSSAERTLRPPGDGEG